MCYKHTSPLHRKKIVKGVERGQSDWIQSVLGRMFFQKGMEALRMGPEDYDHEP